jgi:hypothetical protein
VPLSSLAPLSRVPLLLPRSAISQAPSLQEMEACLSETEGSFTHKQAVFLRPTVALLPAFCKVAPAMGPASISSFMIAATSACKAGRGSAQLGGGGATGARKAPSHHGG